MHFEELGLTREEIMGSVSHVGSFGFLSEDSVCLLPAERREEAIKSLAAIRQQESLDESARQCTLFKKRLASLQRLEADLKAGTVVAPGFEQNIYSFSAAAAFHGSRAVYTSDQTVVYTYKNPPSTGCESEVTFQFRIVRKPAGWPFPWRETANG